MSGDPWWTKTRFRLFLDFHTPDHRDQAPAGTPAAFGALDVVAIAEDARQAGIEAVVFPAKDNQGNFFYPTTLGHHLTDLDGRDLVAEFVDALEPRGIGSVAYFQPIRDKRAFDSRPDWRQVNNDGSERVLQPWLQDGAGGHRLVCPLGEAGEQALGQLDELADRYELDGIWWDRVGDVQGTATRYPCFCESCRRKHRQDTGRDIPRTADWDDPAWKRFWEWRAAALLRFQQRAHEVLRRRGVCLISNYAFYGMVLADPMPLSVDMESTADATDVAALEYQHWRSFLAMSTNPRLIRGLTDRSGEMIMWNIGRVGDGVVRSPEATEAATHTFLAHGHAVTFHDAVDHDGRLDPELFRIVSSTVSRARTMWPLIDGAASLRYAAMLFSPATFMWVGRGDSDLYVREVVGTVRQLLEAHVPFEIVSDRHLQADGLTDLRVLVLPDAACLSDEACAAIEEWVTAGGVLLATHRTSLRTSRGDDRADFGLSTLLGVSKVGDASGPLWMRTVGEELRAQWSNHRVALRAPAVLVEPHEGTSVLGELGVPMEGLEVFSHVIPSPRRWGPHPVLTHRSYGAGHVFHAAGPLASAYLAAGVRELAGPLAATLAAAPRAPVRADAPSSVELIARRDPEGHLVVHLVNLQGEVGRTHRMGTVPSFVHGVSEVVSVHDVEVCTAKPVRSAREVLTGRDLVVEPMGPGSRILLPELDVTACVVLEPSESEDLHPLTQEGRASRVY